MDEKLINAYISNLAAEVQSLKMENILLKTRLNLLEQEKAEAPKEKDADGGSYDKKSAKKD